MVKGFSTDNLQGFYMTIFYDVKILVSIVAAIWAGTYPNSGETYIAEDSWRKKIPACPRELLHISRVFPGEALLLSITSPFTRFQYI